MSSVGGQTEATDTHARRQPLMDAIWAEVDNLVLVWVRVSRQEGLKLGLLALAEFFIRQARKVAVRDAVQTVLADSRRHVPVLWVDDEVGVVPFVRREVVVRLDM